MGQNSNIYIQVVEGGVPHFLFCGHELNTESEQKKHFEIRLFLSFGFGFQYLTKYVCFLPQICLNCQIG